MRRNNSDKAFPQRKECKLMKGMRSSKKQNLQRTEVGSHIQTSLSKGMQREAEEADKASGQRRECRRHVQQGAACQKASAFLKGGVLEREEDARPCKRTAEGTAIRSKRMRDNGRSSRHGRNPHCRLSFYATPRDQPSGTACTRSERTAESTT
jgi:hypothetical protein